MYQGLLLGCHQWLAALEDLVRRSPGHTPGTGLARWGEHLELPRWALTSLAPMAHMRVPGEQGLAPSRFPLPPCTPLPAHRQPSGCVPGSRAWGKAGGWPRGSWAHIGAAQGSSARLSSVRLSSAWHISAQLGTPQLSTTRLASAQPGSAQLLRLAGM